MGSHLTLAAPRYLEWRTRLYAAAVHCYHSVLSALGPAAAAKPKTPGAAAAASGTASGGSGNGTDQQQTGHVVAAPSDGADEDAREDDQQRRLLRPPVAAEHALVFLEEGVASIEHLQALHALDPVPPDLEEAAACEAARAELLALRPLLLARGSAGAGDAGAPQHANGADGSGASAGAAGVPRDESAVAARLRVLASVLASTSGDGSPLQREPNGPPAALASVVHEARSLAADAVAVLSALPSATPRGLNTSRQGRPASSAQPLASPRQKHQQPPPQPQPQLQGAAEGSGSEDELVSSVNRAESTVRMLAPSLHQVGASGLLTFRGLRNLGLARMLHA